MLQLWWKRPRRLRASVDLMRSGLQVERYSSQVAYHEAGHAFAHWYVGSRVHKAQVLHRKPRSYLKSKWGHSFGSIPGVVEGNLHFHDRLKLLNKNSSRKIRKVCLDQIFISYAGPFNTSVILDNYSVDDCLSSSGSNDDDRIKDCRKRAHIGDNPYRRTIGVIVRIMDMPQSRHAMTGIAEFITQHGSIKGADIERICKAAFRSRPCPKIRISN